MNTPLILRVAISTPLWQSFDYLSLSCEPLVPGIRLKVPFGRRETVGVLLDVVAESSFPLEKLKPILGVLDQEPIFSPSLLALCRWASDYYHYPIGEVVLGALPKGLRQGKSVKGSVEMPEIAVHAVTAKLHLNEHQQTAVDAIVNHQGFQTYLLSGITGSGKTEVYLYSIEAILKAHKQALVLVPEIALTPQTVARFQERFSVPVALIHSNVTDKSRLQAWWQARCGTASIIIGTRSAIFTPMLHPGIIILDEEHDPSFKQQSGFRYSARDLAIIRGRMENIPVVLGSATPSLESLYNAERGRYKILTLPERAGDATFPEIKLIDLRRQTLDAGLSPALLTAI